jgi:hypothetical protein
MTRYSLLSVSYGLDFVGWPLWRKDGPVLCQRSLSRAWVPWESRPYFTVSHLRLPFSSHSTTRRVTVEALDPASEGGNSFTIPVFSYKLSARTTHRKPSPSIVAWSRPHRINLSSTVAWRHRACINMFTESLPGNASHNSRLLFQEILNNFFTDIIHLAVEWYNAIEEFIFINISFTYELNWKEWMNWTLFV